MGRYRKGFPLNTNFQGVFPTIWYRGYHGKKIELSAMMIANNKNMKSRKKETEIKLGQSNTIQRKKMVAKEKKVPNAHIPSQLRGYLKQFKKSQRLNTFFKVSCVVSCVLNEVFCIWNIVFSVCLFFVLFTGFRIDCSIKSARNGIKVFVLYLRVD